MSFVSVSRVSLNHWFSGIWLCALECSSLWLSCSRFIELLASELIAFNKFWIFSAISSNIFFCYSFPHQSSSWESNYMYERLLGIAYRSLKLLFFCCFFKFIFSLCSILDTSYCYIFKYTNIFFCSVLSLFNCMKWTFYFWCCTFQL